MAANKSNNMAANKSNNMVSNNGLLVRRNQTQDLSLSLPAHRQNITNENLRMQYNTQPESSIKPTELRARDKSLKIPSTSANRDTITPTTSSPKPTATFVQMVFSWRFVMALILNFSLLVSMLPKFGLSVAIVCMVKPVAQIYSNSSFVGNTTQNTLLVDEFSTPSPIEPTSLNKSLNEMESPPTYEFEWSSEVVGLILSSQYFTSFAGPLLSDYGRRRIGNKLLLALAIGTSALLSFASPWGARVDPYLLVAIGALQGLVTGANIPIIGDSIAFWGPIQEKLTLATVCFAGGNVAGVLSSVVSGYLCSIPIDNGWPFIFYMFGGVSSLWVVLWCVLSSGRPEDHPFISDRELQYIVTHRRGIGRVDDKKADKVPYIKILTSPKVMGLLVTACFHTWILTTTFSYMAIFFNQVLGFSVEETGLLVGLVAVLRFCGMFLWTALGNCLLSSGKFTINGARKLCYCSGAFAAAILCFTTSGLLLMDVDRWTVLILVFVVMICSSCGTSVLPTLAQDMAPRYAGFLTGLQYSTAQTFSLTAPLIISALAPTNSVEEWQILWIVFGGVFCAGSLCFLFLAEASIQPWAHPVQKNLQSLGADLADLGRRMSAFVAAPPLSPVSPTDSIKLNLGISVQLATILPNLTSADNMHLQEMIYEFVEARSTEASRKMGVEIGTQTDATEMSVFPPENPDDDYGTANVAFEQDEVPQDGQRPHEVQTDGHKYSVRL